VTRIGLRLVAAGTRPPRGEVGEPSVSVVLAENHTGLRRSLRFVVETNDGVLRLAEASDLATALRHVGRFRPDVLLFDSRLLDESGIEAVRCVWEQAPRSEIVVLTIDRSRTLGKQALEADALEFVLKDTVDSGFQKPCASFPAIGGTQARACPRTTSPECTRSAVAGGPSPAGDRRALPAAPIRQRVCEAVVAARAPAGSARLT
jgi:CheY-like chemotaxis protein